MLKSSGFAVGIVVGIILIAALFRFANYNRKAKTEYDERQREIRGKAYQLGFYTIVLYEVVMMALAIGEISLPLEGYIQHFAGVVLGCTVLAAYSIWKDVYWGLNNDRKRYGFLFAVLAVMNAVPVVASVRDGSFSFNSVPGVNALVLAMMAVLILMLVVRYFADRRSSSEED